MSDTYSFVTLYVPIVGEGAGWMSLTEAELRVLDEMLSECHEATYTSLAGVSRAQAYECMTISYVPGHGRVKVYHDHIGLGGMLTSHRDPTRRIENYLLDLYQARGVPIEGSVFDSIRAEPNVFEDELPPVYDLDGVYCSDIRVPFNAEWFYGWRGIGEPMWAGDTC